MRLRLLGVCGLLFGIVAALALIPGGVSMANAADGDVELISSDVAGVEGDVGSQSSSMTPDGSYVVFQSYDTNLGPVVPGGWFQIFMKEVATGVVTLVSCTAAGVPSDGDVNHPVITPDRRYVAFHSSSRSGNLPTNLGGAGLNQQVYRKDLTTGAIVLVSCDAFGVEGDADSRRAFISPDGRYIAFESEATNLGGSGTYRQIFLKDINTGAIRGISTNAAGEEAARESAHACMTPDGRYCTFQTGAANLIPGVGGGAPGAGAFVRVFRKNLETGVVELVSCDAAGTNANFQSKYGVITYDGRYVTFYSRATNLGPVITGAIWQVFRKDMVTGAVVLVSCDAAGVEGAAAASQYGDNSISSDGRYVCFISDALNLTAVPTVNTSQVFRKDLVTGEVRLASCDVAGVEANSGGWSSQMTSSGTFITFYSSATNLGPVTSGISQVFRKELAIAVVAVAHDHSNGGTCFVSTAGNSYGLLALLGGAALALCLMTIRRK